MGDSAIIIKTIKWSSNVLDYLGAFDQAMELESGTGYCEKNLKKMENLSNRQICDSSTKENVGFRYTITFHVCSDTTKYAFNFPVILDMEE